MLQRGRHALCTVVLLSSLLFAGVSCRGDLSDYLFFRPGLFSIALSSQWLMSTVVASIAVVL